MSYTDSPANQALKKLAMDVKHTKQPLSTIDEEDAVYFDTSSLGASIASSVSASLQSSAFSSVTSSACSSGVSTPRRNPRHSTHSTSHTPRSDRSNGSSSKLSSQIPSQLSSRSSSQMPSRSSSKSSSRSSSQMPSRSSSRSSSRSTSGTATPIDVKQASARRAPVQTVTQYVQPGVAQYTPSASTYDSSYTSDFKRPVEPEVINELNAYRFNPDGTPKSRDQVLQQTIAQNKADMLELFRRANSVQTPSCCVASRPLFAQDSLSGNTVSSVGGQFLASVQDPSAAVVALAAATNITNFEFVHQANAQGTYTACRFTKN